MNTYLLLFKHIDNIRTKLIQERWLVENTGLENQQGCGIQIDKIYNLNIFEILFLSIFFDNIFTIIIQNYLIFKFRNFSNSSFSSKVSMYLILTFNGCTSIANDKLIF